MFDEYLQKRARQSGEAFRPFDLATDYRLYVDGKPRFDGVRDFSAHAVSNSTKETLTTQQRSNSVRTATARTT